MLEAIEQKRSGHAEIRYASLDYLRGLMALAVLVFHYDKWLRGSWDAATLQGKLGVYAVAIFFILSGLTLSLVYKNRLNWSVSSLVDFFRKRFFRIYPLLILATFLTLLIDDVSRSTWDIFLNFSGLFGFLNPAKDIATGAWSIGCELVFYAAFPTLLLQGKRASWILWSLFLVLSGLAFWLAFSWFSPMQPEQAIWWEPYVQVANQAFFFVGGMVIGCQSRFFIQINTQIWRIIGLLAALVFIAWPTGNDAITLIYGWNRVGFSLLSFLLVMAVLNSKLELNGLLHQFLSWLGAISYSLYLLHPLVFRVLRAVFAKIGWAEHGALLFGLALLGSLVLSHCSYYWMEKPLANRA